ncbi:hypothetical protein SAMN05443667_10299 [Flavobacterium gillisiae]|uniref:Uncharacterized protein n=1 Tax=Flavobacterium gillisiae TaxID=150146 RepID=A0A1H3YS56_9FLAO|nr:hypothetical protein [Flavobacterium gillisiae]SEA14011.1 hypothetical protein SAMN05443667_10299 [Flavobacterium gillisiae]
MKKITFLVASILLIGGGVANATERNTFSLERRVAVDFRNAEPIVFMESGVEFFIFTDGQFDFNTRPDARHKYNRPYSSGNKNYDERGSHNNRYYGVNVEHDRMGRVRRIGNISISYDRNDRVQRVGSVQMSYNRYALERVGGLEIIYNRRGQVVDTFGSVKGSRVYRNNDNDHCDSGYNQVSNDYADYDFRSQDIIIDRHEPRVGGSVAVRIGGRN